MGGGFVVDMFSGKRGLLLAGSLFTMGLGYLLVAAAPNYTILLIPPWLSVRGPPRSGTP